jgi:PAS domain S-box-containing protein
MSSSAQPGDEGLPLRDALVLVVDDHADLAENLREILSDEGAIVRIAETAAQARLLAQSPFDVALVDVRLPDATGLELVPELKRDEGMQEVLLVTGHASIQDAIEAVRAGAYAYVLKPFDPEDLITTVARAVERVRLRRRAAMLQHALERSEAALRTMVDTVQALLLVLDERGQVVDANPAVATATGTSLEEIRGGNWVEACVPPRDQRAFARACEMAAGGVGVGVEAAVLQRNGGESLRERAVSWRLSGITVDDELRIYASGLDMTEIRDLERRTRLAEKLAAVGTVSAGLAHEIRNPLNAAILQLQLLERRVAKADVDGKIRETADIVRAEIGRLSHLVTDFLQFARPQAINPRDLDLVQCVGSVVSLQRPVARERRIELSLHAAVESLVIEGDAERLKQIVLNLVSNAIEAIDEGGRVEVRVEPYGAGARLVVQDDGPGVPEDCLARIFEPFFTTKHAGTGLGMAITHSLVELHGGTIEVTNVGGARFCVELPRHTPRPIAMGTHRDQA